MPILKTEILGSIIEINYEVSEKNQLEIIIRNFKKRLLDLKNLQSKVSDKKILFLAALKAEDELINGGISKDVIGLKDKISMLENKNENLENLNSKAIKEIEEIEKKNKSNNQ